MATADAVEPPGKVTSWIRGTRSFLVHVRAELAKVTWPSREELIDATKRVLIMTLAIGVVLGLLDRVLQFLLVDGIAALSR